MDVYVISDIHLEFYSSIKKVMKRVNIIKKWINNPVEYKDAVLILAGDIGYPFNTKMKRNMLYVEFLTKMKSIFKHVVMIPGNHEYYIHGNIGYIDNAIHEICESIGIIFLQRSTWTHESGIIFCGVTLWSNVSKEASTKMNDLNFLNLSYDDIISRHHSDVMWLTEQINQAIVNNYKLIIITHHTPSIKCISDKYISHETTSGYYTNLETIISNPPVLLWTCGHTHSQKCVTINNCKIVINPIGYPNEIIQDNINENPIHIQLPNE